MFIYKMISVIKNKYLYIKNKKINIFIYLKI